MVKSREAKKKINAVHKKYYRLESRNVEVMVVWVEINLENKIPAKLFLNLGT